MTIIKEKKVLFIGIGNMGSRMVHRLSSLLFNPFDVYTFNRSKIKINSNNVKFLSVIPDSIEYDIIVSMVADDNASRDVFFGEYGVLNKMKSNAIIIECSTLSPSYAKELSKKVKSLKSKLYLAPVIGSTDKAELGQLHFLVSGPKETMHVVSAFLKFMGNKISYLGENYKSTILKLINNFLITSELITLGIALDSAIEAGIDENSFYSILSNNQSFSPLMTSKLHRHLKERDNPVNARVELLKKDIEYVGQCFGRNETKTKIHEIFSDILNEACSDDFKNQDISEIIGFMKTKDVQQVYPCE